MINPAINLVAIVGPTASGKTQLAIELARQFNGEIVCADSRTVYRGMDIGTAKPTLQERQEIPHHLLDLIDPDETLSASAFKDLAEAAIEDVAARGKLPLLVGGSGLYIDAVLYDYDFLPPPDEARRRELETMETNALLQLLASTSPAAYNRIDLRNRRRVIRAIETAGRVAGRSNTPRRHTLALGLLVNKEVIQKRIQVRIEKSLHQGIIEEVRSIGERFGWESEAMSGNAYRTFKEVVLGAKTEAEGAADNIRADLLLYKKQMTWFKRDPTIAWLEDPTMAAPKVAEFLGQTV